VSRSHKGASRANGAATAAGTAATGPRTPRALGDEAPDLFGRHALSVEDVRLARTPALTSEQRAFGDVAHVDPVIPSAERDRHAPSTDHRDHLRLRRESIVERADDAGGQHEHRVELARPRGALDEGGGRCFALSVGAERAALVEARGLIEDAIAVGFGQRVHRADVHQPPYARAHAGVDDVARALDVGAPQRRCVTVGDRHQRRAVKHDVASPKRVGERVGGGDVSLCALVLRAVQRAHVARATNDRARLDSAGVERADEDVAHLTGRAGDRDGVAPRGVLLVHELRS
jgi:hypothetical protein